MSLQQTDQSMSQDSIQDLVSAAADILTPTERRIAEVVVADPTLIAFGSVSDLAGRADTSRPSIVRFATKLGFQGYTDLQSWVRRGVVRQLSKPSDRVRRGKHTSDSSRQEIVDATLSVADVFADGKLATLAEPIVGARNVWIISGESSRAGAYVLLSGLSMIRPSVSLIEAHTVGRDMCHADQRDVAVAFDFTRYRRNAVTTAKGMVDLGVPLVAITDSPLSPLAALTPLWCELKIPPVGPFDSSLPAVAAAEILVAEVVDQLGNKAAERIDKLEQQWRATGTFYEA
ncbi:MAG: MurR/RpiR family transcriptional regulator [Leptolyngbya sp. SIO3F4]|nr:MurR/RpiR family transcriptional regulator [Leptolyngbya sp. SIO3F4]